MTHFTLEDAAVATGVISVYLTGRQNIWNWPVGIVNVVLYAAVFYRTRLYADVALQIVYTVLQVYGWYHWLHPGDKETTRGQLPVTRTPARTALALVPIAAAGSALLGWLFATYTSAALPYLDSATTAVSLVAQWMMTRKLLENWLVWIAVDVVYVGMYWYKALHKTAGLYAVFLVLAVMGYLAWRRSLRATRAESLQPTDSPDAAAGAES